MGRIPPVVPASRWIRAAILTAALAVGVAATAAPLGNAITYQGSLTEAGQPAQGAYDLRIQPFDAATGTNALGPARSLDDVAVERGLFTVELDFGPGFFVGDDVWLQVEVRPGASTGAYTALSPRQRLAAAPYALKTQANSVTAIEIAPGAVGAADANLAELQARVTGTCTAGSSIRAIAASGAVTCDAGPASNGWLLGGNAGTTPATAQVGTTDGAALRLQGDAGVLVNHAGPALGTLHVRRGAVSNPQRVPGDASLVLENTSSQTLALVGGSNSTQQLVFRSNADTRGAALVYDGQSNAFILRLTTNVFGPFDIEPIRVSTTGITLANTRASAIGVDRFAATNALEVEGNASKTTAGSWLANSDARIKTDVRPVEGAVDTLLRVRPVTFTYTDDYRAAHPSVGTGRYWNVVAQEFAQVFPDAVRGSGEYLDDAKSADAEILQVDLHPALVTGLAATRELAVDVRALQAEIATLSAENQRLQARLAALERLMLDATRDGAAR